MCQEYHIQHSLCGHTRHSTTLRCSLRLSPSNVRTNPPRSCNPKPPTTKPTCTKTHISRPKPTLCHHCAKSAEEADSDLDSVFACASSSGSVFSDGMRGKGKGKGKAKTKIVGKTTTAAEKDGAGPITYLSAKCSQIKAAFEAWREKNHFIFACLFYLSCFIVLLVSDLSTRWKSAGCLIVAVMAGVVYACQCLQDIPRTAEKLNKLSLFFEDPRGAVGRWLGKLWQTVKNVNVVLPFSQKIMNIVFGPILLFCLAILAYKIHKAGGLHEAMRH